MSDKPYRTSDIYFSAFLCSIGYAIQENEKHNNKITFIFMISESDLASAKSLYFGGSGSVKARVFVDNIRSLKQMCYI